MVALEAAIYNDKQIALFRLVLYATVLIAVNVLFIFLPPELSQRLFWGMCLVFITVGLIVLWAKSGFSREALFIMPGLVERQLFQWLFWLVDTLFLPLSPIWQKALAATGLARLMNKLSRSLSAIWYKAAATVSAPLLVYDGQNAIQGKPDQIDAATHNSAYRLPLVTRLGMVLEIGLIVASAIIFTRHLQDWSPAMQWGDLDLPLVTHGAAYASVLFQKTGLLSLWNPFIGRGEPMLESLQSFILNPLMASPMLLLGPTQGTKFAILLHIGLMGLGGWALARILGLQMPGRLLLGVLLVGTGSMAGPLGRGLYQLGLSQAYTPWIFAGLIGTLYTTRRWCVGLLVISTMLLIFAGTFWYVLPTAISCLLIVAFSLNRKHKQAAIRRLFIATGLILGLCAIRLLPINRALLAHATVGDFDTTTFLGKMGTYFLPVTLRLNQSDAWMNYHYVFPIVLAFLISIGLTCQIVFRSRKVLDRTERGGPPPWTTIIPIIMIIILFTLWGLGETPVLNWIYTSIPFLADWRNSGRIAAAASIWIVVLGAMGFDNLIMLSVQLIASRDIRATNTLTGQELFDRRELLALARGGLVVLTIAAVFGAIDVLGNWARFDFLTDISQKGGQRGEIYGLTYLRAHFPNDFLRADSVAWITHFYFAQTLIRANIGDHDVFTEGLPATIGSDSTMQGLSEFDVTVNPVYAAWLQDNGYQPYLDSPQSWDSPSAWHNPSALSYAFWVPRGVIKNLGNQVLEQQQTQPVSYFHRIDNIELTVSNYGADSVLVVDETDYPGWHVTVNGASTVVESVGGRLAVALPNQDRAGPIQVVFSYRPTTILVGAALLFVTSILFVIYQLRLDTHISELKRRRFEVRV